MKNATRIAPDPIFQLLAQYRADKREEKINGGIGVYVSDSGKPFVLPVVRKVVKDFQRENYNYLPIAGSGEFLTQSAQLVLGSKVFSSLKSRVSLQGVAGGTNGLYLWAQAFGFSAKKSAIIAGVPTWGNHQKIFLESGIDTIEYEHETTAHTFNLSACIKTLKKYKGQTVLFHGAYSHNPTGVNPTKDDWNELIPVLIKQGHRVLLDVAYLGLGKGLSADRWFVQEIVSKKIPVSIVLSYSKNMSLYQHRTGCLIEVHQSEKQKDEREVLMQYLFRIVISNPPAFGESIVSSVLSDGTLFKMWRDEVQKMYLTVKKRRDTFVSSAPERFSYLRDNSGFYGLLHLSKKEIETLKTSYGIYILPNSRINFAGIRQADIPLIVQAITAVTSSHNS